MTAPVRFFTDEHVAKAVAVGLRKRGVDALSIAETDWLGADDEPLLAFAQEQQRTIVTQDQDFLRLAAQKADHPGIAYAPQGRSIGELVRMLDLLAQVSNADDMHGRVEYL